jgi:nicotinamidase-related amidase
MSDSRPVLLLMDFQHGIVERIGDPAVVDAADRAAKAARAAGIPVMFVRVAGWSCVIASPSWLIAPKDALLAAASG